MLQNNLEWRNSLVFTKESEISDIFSNRSKFLGINQSEQTEHQTMKMANIVMVTINVLGFLRNLLIQKVYVYINQQELQFIIVANKLYRPTLIPTFKQRLPESIFAMESSFLALLTVFIVQSWNVCRFIRFLLHHSPKQLLPLKNTIHS